MATTGAYNRQNREGDERRDYGRKSYGEGDKSNREVRGERTRTERNRDDKPRGEKRYDDKPRGERRFDDKPRGERRFDDKPRGERRFDDKPRGERRFDDKPRSERRFDDKPRGEFKKSGDFKDGGYKQNSFPKGFDKDKDDDSSNNRHFKSAPRDNKPKEQTSDKMEVKNRLEKEKKAMKKKQAENRKEMRQPAKHQAKPKRVGNIDWTRAYENDSYDDDDLDMYL